MGKINIKDYLYNEKQSSYELSLSKLVGKKIVDIVGYATDPFGGTPLFKINKIVFDDGTYVRLEGEHDVPYIPANDKLNNMDEETLQSLIDADE